jgi:hypothetical protein
MGLFDDLMGIAKEFNDIKSEVTGAIGDMANDLTGLKDEATSAVTQLKDEATSVKDGVVENISAATGDSTENQ